MWQDYRFVAVLDPYELSDGVEVLDLDVVDHRGRVAWEALLRPTEAYEPRCSCCSLMRTSLTDLAEGLDRQPAYADVHRVRLDVGTELAAAPSHNVRSPGPRLAGLEQTLWGLTIADDVGRLGVGT